MGLARIKAGPTCLYIYSICIFAILSLAVTSAPDIIHWDMVSNHMRFGGQLVVQKLPAKRIYHYHKTLQNTSASSVRSCNSSRQSWHLMSCNKKLNRRSIEPLTCGPAVDSLQNSSKPTGAFAWLEPQMISNFCQIISGIAFHQISSDGWISGTVIPGPPVHVIRPGFAHSMNQGLAIQPLTTPPNSSIALSKRSENLLVFAPLQRCFKFWPQ